MRYTTKDDVIYATLLGWPGNNKTIQLNAFSKEAWKGAQEIDHVALLGSDEKIDYALSDEGLQLTTPNDPVDEMAVVFKIALK